MPASPRATVIGLGLAALIVAAIVLVPAAVLTGYFSSLSQRDRAAGTAADAIAALKSYGREFDAIPQPSPIAVPGTPMRLLPVVGEYSAFESQAIPLDRQPKPLVVYLGATEAAGLTEIAAADLLRPGPDPQVEPTLADRLGPSGAIGVPVAFADGTVWMLHDTTPAREVAQFMRRDTMAQNDRDRELTPFRLEKRER